MASLEHRSIAGPPPRSKGLLGWFLDSLERIGNRLPDQVTIFAVLAMATLLLSWWAGTSGLSIIHPVTKQPVVAVNLLNREGLRWILSSVAANFTGFAPLGTVLVAMVGVGVAERSGLFGAMLKAIVLSVPRYAITPTIVFAGIMSHVAADAGYVILPPVAAMIFVSLGRHPLAGVAAAVAGIGGGFSANLLLSSIDPLLAGLTQQAAQLYQPDYQVNPACNYYFMSASTILLVLIGWYVNDRIVEPRLGPWRDPNERHAQLTLGSITETERRGLIAAVIACAAVIAVILLLVVPKNAILRDAESVGSQQYKPFFDAVVALIMVFFLVPGVTFGIATRAVRSDRDAARMMTETMAAMGQFLVIAFFAGQFIAWFNRSKLGFIFAVEGAEFLQAIRLTGPALMVGLIMLTATINLLMASASAKWTILAPIFVPMMMALGKSPESVQAYYRVGDSVTNIITPLNYYFPIVLAALHRYVPQAGLGTLIAALFPYSVAFFIGWTLLLLVWSWLGFPLGPGTPWIYAA